MNGCIEKIISLIKTDPEFKVVSEHDTRYCHMGATITDAVLQAGIAYETVVRPRVEAVKRNFPEARTTSGFLEVLRRVGPEKVLKWRGREKLERILALTGFLASKGIEIEEQLASWIAVPENADKLLRLRGIGKKTVDYLSILVGVETFAIDTHVRAFLRKAGVPFKDYDDAKKLLIQVADMLDVSCSSLDHSIWVYMSGKCMSDPTAKARGLT